MARRFCFIQLRVEVQELWSEFALSGDMMDQWPISDQWGTFAVSRPEDRSASCAFVHTLYTRLWIVTCRKDQQRLVYSRILVIQKTGNVNIFVKKTACPFNLAILIPTVPTFSPTVPTVLTFSPTPRFDVVSCVVVSDIERPRLSRTGVHGQFLPQKKAAERLLMPRFDLNDSQRISITAVIVMKKS